MDERKQSPLLFRILDRLDSVIAPVILTILFIDVILQILSRVIPGNALPWTVEVGEVGLGALIWFGISVAVRDNNHVRFDLVVRGFPDKMKKYVATLGYTIFSVYLIWLAVLTVELLMQYRKLDSKTTILQISMFWIRLPILIGCVSATIRLLFKQYRILTNQEEAFAAGEHLD